MRGRHHCGHSALVHGNQIRAAPALCIGLHDRSLLLVLLVYEYWYTWYSRLRGSIYYPSACLSAVKNRSEKREKREKKTKILAIFGTEESPDVATRCS